MTRDPNLLFELRVKPWANEPTIIIRAFDANENEPGYWGVAAARIDVEVRQGGQVVFPRGSLWIGTPRAGHWSLDGDEAREAVLACVAMRLGDTDADYFDHYTPTQLDWASRNGEALSCARDYRFCDPNTGNFIGSKAARNLRRKGTL